MKPRQKTFLLAAVPFAIISVGLWWVSIRASAMFTGAGVVAFSYALTRPTGRKLAHTPCVFCSRKIIFEHQGEFCPTCQAGLHASCLDEHRMSAHAPAKDQPFR